MVRQNRIRQATAFNGRGSRPFQDDKVAVGYISIIHITVGAYYIRKLTVLEEFVKLGWLLYLSSFFFFFLYLFLFDDLVRERGRFLIVI